MSAPRGPLVVVGDALVDYDVDGEVHRISPDAPVPIVEGARVTPRPGGAALAAAMAASFDNSRPVVLLTALSTDPAGVQLSAMLEEAGVEVIAVPLEGPTSCKVRFRSGGQSLLRYDVGGASTPRGAMPEGGLSAIDRAGAVVVSDYGLGVAAMPEVRQHVAALRKPVVWDPHPRGALPVEGACLVVPNKEELLALAGQSLGRSLGGPAGSAHAGEEHPLASVCRMAEAALRAWRAQGVAVTLGEGGAVLVCDEGPPLVVPAGEVGSKDTCGAGDRFAVAAAGALAEGALPSEAVSEAVALSGEWVLRGGASGWSVCQGGAPGWSVRPAASAPRAGELVELLSGPRAPAAGSIPPGTRHPGARHPGARHPGARHPGTWSAGAWSAGGRHGVRGPVAGGLPPATLVATGGCFDVLHAGHVQLLETARALGDRLVVCLNSDASVRRLKGAGRPVVCEADRAAMLGALACVDEVVVFEEDTPARVLGELRPQLFVKGGDYAGQLLAEQDVLSCWGGQVLVVPYLAGRSTTRVIRQAREATV